MCVRHSNEHVCHNIIPQFAVDVKQNRAAFREGDVSIGVSFSLSRIDEKDAIINK